MTASDFPRTREAALASLHDFVPRAGRAYAAHRNDASADVVSRLSPAIRHRLIAEPEVLRATLAAHSFDAAEKFIQEVCWRSYWKGWLELRPSVWADHCAERDALHPEWADNAGYQSAINGEIGIVCFDDWAAELVRSGYLHNHVRMWVASIWIFTLELPWALGADWFMAHLLDGDAASNTLSWRWVAGLQTPSKHYLARAENIHKFTGGQYKPASLNESAEPLATASDVPKPQAPEWPTTNTVAASDALLLSCDDLTPDCDGLHLPDGVPIATVEPGEQMRRMPVAQQVLVYQADAMEDARARLQAAGHKVKAIAVDRIAEWFAHSGGQRLVMPWMPVGPDRDAVFAELDAHNIPWAFWQRAWDAAVWPQAQRGYFNFKKRVLPNLQRLL